jgi:hypothetical protein
MPVDTESLAWNPQLVQFPCTISHASATVDLDGILQQVLLDETRRPDVVRLKLFYASCDDHSLSAINGLHDGVNDDTVRYKEGEAYRARRAEAKT